MLIRKMLIEDYDRVYELWMSCKGMGLNNIDDSKEGIERFLVRNFDTCFVAEDGNIIKGVIMVGNDGRRGYIYHTAVLPSCRNGINKVALVVFDRNESGNKFWEKQGFTVREDLIYRNKTLTDMVRIDT